MATDYDIPMNNPLITKHKGMFVNMIVFENKDIAKEFYHGDLQKEAKRTRIEFNHINGKVRAFYIARRPLKLVNFRSTIGMTIVSKEICDVFLRNNMKTYNMKNLTCLVN
jgi:hypothetical protein